MRRRNGLGLLVAVVLMVGILPEFTLPARADIRIVTREGTSLGEGSENLPPAVRESLAAQEPVVATLWLSTDRSARVDKNSHMIARLDRGEVYIVDAGAESYTVLPLGGEGETLGGAWEIVDTGETERIGEWSTRKLHLTVELGGQPVEVDLWVADLGVDLAGFRAFTEAVAQAMGADWMRAYLEIDGYPVRQEVRVGGMLSWQEIESVSEETPPSGTYEVPAGFTRKE